MAGVPRHRLRRLIAKEVTDNGLDACDRAGSAGTTTIERDGDDIYVVTDQGGGIDPAPAALADLFSTERAMLSGKFWRLPTRGVLGNGLRVLVAAVALSGGTITVESRGVRTVLRPRRIGATDIVEQTASDVTTGTRLHYTLDAGTIPADGCDLDDARAAIMLAAAAGPPYARRPSPHWLDLDHLAEICTSIEPPDTTVRQLIEQLDGCTGALAGKLAAPHGNGRTARSMTDDAELAALLIAMQDAARLVKPKGLGPIGADAFGEGFDGYIIQEAALRVGAHEPHAICPVLLEAWASVTSRKSGDTKLFVFCNRSPVVGDAVATRGYGSRIVLSGAGLDGTSFDAEGGTCTLILSVQAPLIPTTSLGKAPHLSVLSEEIAATVRRAFVRSRNRLPQDPKQPKPPKHEPPPKPERPPPYEPSGALAAYLANVAELARVKAADLLVLSPKYDPFNETRASRRDAEWFAEQIKRFVPWGTVHIRGTYYRILSAGDVKLPDGRRFEGTHETAELVESAAKHARHLRLVGFNRIVDERAAPPEFYDTEGDFADPADPHPVERRLIVKGSETAVTLPSVGAMLPTISATEVPRPRQPFRLCMIGEKVSLGPVLRPLAKWAHSELLLLTGEISETQAYGIIARAAEDGRPLRILYFADFDPSGWQMTVSLSRKFQAHIVAEFPDVDVRVIRVALTFEQVVEFGLPDSPIKTGDKRSKKWREKWGCEQVEIDALAALRPELLDRIARDALAPYFDPTLEERYAAALSLTTEVQGWFEGLPARKALVQSLEAAHAPAKQAIEALNKAAAKGLADLRKAVDEAENKPYLEPVEVKAEITTPEPTESVFDSADDFVTATRKLQAIKALAPDDDNDGTRGGIA
jgi:hypothetical protein